MTPRRALQAAAVAVLVAFAGSAADARRITAHVSTVQPGRGRSVEAVALGDLDGDGLDDLVVATSRRRDFKRSLLVHLRGRGETAFGNVPSRELAVPRDVVACALADVMPEPGREIVLFTATGAFAWRPDAAETERFPKLLDAKFLWQLPHPRELFFWQSGVADMNGDGLDDLVIPEPGGYLIAFQSRGRRSVPGFATQRLRLPALGELRVEPKGAQRLRARRERRRALTGKMVESGRRSGHFLVSITDDVPAPTPRDFDGDGLLDLLAQTPEFLHVWRQGPPGHFSEAPTSRYDLPVIADRKRRLDVSYSAHAEDLDRDGRVDCVMFAGDKRADDVRTQVLAFRQGAGKGASEQSTAAPLFGPRGVPQQLLVIAGFAGDPRLFDVDGDGAKDIVVANFRLDGLDTIRAAASGTIDAELLVYRNQRGVFSKQPAMSLGLAVDAKGIRGRRERRRLEARFIGDATGNGSSELFLREERERVRVLMTRSTKDGIEVFEQSPLWEMRVDEDAKLGFHRTASGSPEVLLIEDGQVLHVRFR